MDLSKRTTLLARPERRGCGHPGDVQAVLEAASARDLQPPVSSHAKGSTIYWHRWYRVLLVCVADFACAIY